MTWKRTTRGLALATGLAVAACTGSTTIRSDPPGATVYLDGRPVGTTPYQMRDRKIVGSTTRVRLEHEGYAPIDTAISRDERVDVGALIGGLFFVVPFLWIMEYEPTHHYQLEKADGELAGNQADGEPTGAQDVAQLARRANDLNSAGRELMSQGDTAGAVAKFQAAIASFQDPRYYFNLCVALDADGRPNEAIEACETVYDHQPSPRLEEKTDAFLEGLRERAGAGA